MITEWTDENSIGWMAILPEGVTNPNSPKRLASAYFSNWSGGHWFVNWNSNGFDVELNARLAAKHRGKGHCRTKTAATRMMMRALRP